MSDMASTCQRRHRWALMVFMIPAAVAAERDALAQPLNDECVNAITVYSDVPYTGSSVGATGTDLTTCGNSDNRDVWLAWSADCNGTAIFDLCASGFDTTLAIFDACGGAQLACNDDSPTGCTAEDRSRITNFSVQRNRTYLVRVAGHRGATGGYTLLVTCLRSNVAACCIDGACQMTTKQQCNNLGGRYFTDETCDTVTCEPPPPNDGCQDAIPIRSGVPFTGSSAGATGSDITSCGVEDADDVWLVWEADCNGKATFDLCGSAFDTTLAVFDACHGTQLACNDDAVTCSNEYNSTLFDVPVIRGTRYYLRIAGHRGATGNYIANVTCIRDGTGACCLGVGDCRLMPREPCEAAGGWFFEDERCDTIPCDAPPPPNDLCSQAQPVLTDVTYTGSTVGAGGAGASACRDDGADVWFSWQSTCQRRACIDLCGSRFDTTLSVFDACGGRELACNDDEPLCTNELTSRIRSLPVTPGSTYWIRVAGYKGATGDYALRVSCRRELAGRDGGERRITKSLHGVPPP